MFFTRTGKVADTLKRARDMADWDLVASRYRQCAEIATDPDCHYLPDELPGLLAEAVSRTSASYPTRDGELAEHALAVIAEVDGRESFNERLYQKSYLDPRFRRLPMYDEAAPGRRRRPTPYEAVVETTRRLRDADRLHDAMVGSGTSGVLGGSASYGPFYNVRGNAGTTASDLDVMIIAAAGQLGEVGERLQHVLGVSKASIDALQERIKIFNERFDDGQTVLSHKLEMWSDGHQDPLLAWSDTSPRYMMSVHIMAREVLDYVLVDAPTKLMRDSAGTKRTVRDYRDTRPTRDDHQRTFAGRNHCMQSEVDEVAHGYLRPSRVYFIDENDSYCPGLFQNLVLPRLELRWDEHQVATRLDRFKWKMQERLLHERRMRPHAHLRLSFSHTRREVFAPHVVRSVDETELLG